MFLSRFWRLGVCTQQGHSNASSCEGSKSSSPSKPWAPPWKKKSGFSVWGLQNTCTPLKFNPKQFSESVFQTSAIFKHVSKVFDACVRKKTAIIFWVPMGHVLAKTYPSQETLFKGSKTSNSKLVSTKNVWCFILVRFDLLRIAKIKIRGFLLHDGIFT